MMSNITLDGLANGNVTDLEKGTIRNADAVLLILHAYSGVATKGEILAVLKAWRPEPCYGYLFQSAARSGGYGFVADSYEQAHNDVYHHPHIAPNGTWKGGHTSRRRTYYYRKSHGVYAITAEGMARLAELGIN